MTAQLQIQQTLVAALQSAPAVAGGRVYTNPVREVPATAPSAVAISLQRSTGQSPSLGVTDWRTTYQVDCMTRTASASSEPAAAIDTLLADVYQRLAALGATAGLGLMDLAVEPAIAWDYADGATPITTATVFVTATHRTATSNLEPWP